METQKRNKTKYIKITLVILVISILFFLDWYLGKLAEKPKVYSTSIDDSKENKVFLREYKLETMNLPLELQNGINFQEIWVEEAYTYGKLKKDSSFQKLIIKIDARNDTLFSYKTFLQNWTWQITDSYSGSIGELLFFESFEFKDRIEIKVFVIDKAKNKKEIGNVILKQS